MKLSESEKAQLKAEEIFRAEIRASLPKKFGYNKFVEFLQTPLGGIIISTFIVGSASLLWNYLLDIRRENKSKNELIKKMDKEVEYRIFQLSRQYYRDSLYRSNHPLSFAQTDIAWLEWKTFVLEFKNAPSQTKFQCAYQDFYNLNTFALMTQLGDLVETSDSTSIKQVALDIANNKYLPPLVNGYQQYDNLARQLKGNIRLKRWRKYFNSGLR